MKKVLVILTAAALAVSLTACNNEAKPAASGGVIHRPVQTANESSQSQNGTVVPDGETSTAESSKILIAYFTVPETDGVDAVANASRVVKGGEILGNTQYVPYSPLFRGL